MMPFNIGVRAHDISANSREELGRKLLDFGFSHIQLAVGKSFPEFAPNVTAISSGTGHYLGDYLGKLGIKISILGCYVNISSPDNFVREQAIQAFQHHLSLANQFNASVVGTETGSLGNGYTQENFTETAYCVARNSVSELVDYAEHLGVIVGIEAGINHPLYTAELAKRLVREMASPNLKVILDCANLISIENYQSQEKVVYQALDLLRDDICSLHLKDFIVENEQIKIVPVGTGMMKYDQILQFLKRDKPLMFASLEATPEKNIPHALTHLAQIYDK
ncbi:AP endonuclease [Lactococcus hodotermopsidis]|uniref:AP endonuclease n=1 Tax=Pseudolactococcus hodotermopsidis TaxID=2709157 RepID=A0A6A0B943_9LACT|nr:sugar phosphate isomerase/epimerase [Lactococcus hodotermopsidis]GFH41950.1 AP endonuclease [Lactococcus hodotermopsidis]